MHSSISWWENSAADVRFAARIFRRHRGFSPAAVLSLALGIGASTAIFSVVYALLLDPYPYRDAARIVAPTFSDRQSERGRMWYTVPDFSDLRRDSRTLADAFLAEDISFTSTGALTERVRGVAYSPNAFAFLGVPARLGRVFGPADIPAPQTPPQVAVLSHGFWQRHFQSDPAVVGKTVVLDHRPYTILGVMPPRFAWSGADVYVPLAMIPDPRKLVTLTARLGKDANLAGAGAELQALTERFAARTPHLYPTVFHMQATRLNDLLLGKFEATLLILLAAVGCLLLIACGNTSILLLARANARQAEIAVRSALGATRPRLIRQLLTESILLALAGGLLGLLLAYLGVPALVAFMPPYAAPPEAVIEVNGAVAAFSVAISCLTGILFGLAPALQSTRIGLRRALDETQRGLGAGLRGSRIRNLLIVVQIAMTTILAAAAGVAIRGFIALEEVRPGFDSAHVLALYLSPRETEYRTYEGMRRHLRAIAEGLRTAPGVESVTETSTAVPPWAVWDSIVGIAGRQNNAAGQSLIGLIGADYFSTLRIAILQGRSITSADIEHGRPVAVINQEFLSQYWPDGANPAGQKVHVRDLENVNRADLLTPPSGGADFEIIGVASSHRNQGLTNRSRPAIYIPYTRLFPGNCVFLVRVSGEPHHAIPGLRRRIQEIDPDQTVLEAETIDDIITRTERDHPRFSTLLFSLFAAVALTLAGTGLYSVLSYVVARRTHEFGIRMALGARPGEILELVMGETARLVLAGLAIGAVGALSLNRVIARYLDGWDARDPVALAGVAAALALAALTACYVPARRAISVEPMQALRHE